MCRARMSGLKEVGKVWVRGREEEAEGGGGEGHRNGEGSAMGKG